MKKRIGGEIEILEAVKEKYDKENAYQRKVLNEMIKQSQSLNASSEKKEISKKKKDEKTEVDVNKLMDEIKVNILNTYGMKDT